ncbi:hypothetical protein PHMEG_00021757 [Phytophthora megakarya]|uniref:Uncharacterized protein n=1 Tax=Phytophthora megakarya TaxID=4795 RepID=A0A225VKG8_9STRA|nr:hypothetical protein PHMEG_00021757 [Phytophthora megakarya]
MLPRRQYAPDNACIPGRQQTRQYNIADVDPWVIEWINTLTIMTMTLEGLSRALPFRPEWNFPSHLPRSAVSRTGQYFSHLITGQNVHDLMAASQCHIETRSANIADPQLHRREPADLIEALAECDAADPWSTHYRLHHAGYTARRITRLAGKFFNMAALNPNAPPLAPQP